MGAAGDFLSLAVVFALSPLSLTLAWTWSGLLWLGLAWLAALFPSTTTTVPGRGSRRRTGDDGDRSLLFLRSV